MNIHKVCHCEEAKGRRSNPIRQDSRLLRHPVGVPRNDVWSFSRKVVSNVSMVIILLVILATDASAGFIDTFNRTVQQTTTTIETTKSTVKRAANVIPKSVKAPAAKPAEQVTAPQSSGALTAKDKAAIEKAKRAWVAAFKSEDWDALVDQYAEDAVVLPADEEAVSGHEAIRAVYASDEDTSKEVFETISIGGDANIAYVQGAFSFTIKSGDNPPVDASGKYIEIWQKQSDGNWLITHDIWNANPA